MGHLAHVREMVVRVNIFILGDCQTVTCPARAPYPVGCQVFFPWWTDPIGCVASTPTNSSVFFKAGDRCDQGLVTGYLNCSTTPGTGLNFFNCPITKPIPLYVPNASMCPGS